MADDDDPAVDGPPAVRGPSAQLLARALERLEAGDPGDPQDEAQASYAGVFEPEYVEVDWSRPAREVHNQTRAWKLSPPVGGRRGAAHRARRRGVRLVRTSLRGDRGGRPVACGDGPIWVLESEPVAARD